MSWSAVFPLVGLLLASCLQLAGESTDAGASEDAGDGGTADASPAGTGCGQDPYTGATLCLGISSCPDLTVDQVAFPGCGFRPSGGTLLDLECSCSGYLCPVGVATSCSQAQALMQQQNQSLVCAQVSAGGCVQGAGTSHPTTCDQTCAGACVDDPACISACGC